VAGRELADRRLLLLADLPELARAAGLERARGGLTVEGMSPSSTMCFFSTAVSAIGIAHSSAELDLARAGIEDPVAELFRRDIAEIAMAAPRVDRRLAAIMAMDVVGYSRLIGADEAGTLARVKSHRVELAEPLIAKHRGRVVKLTGDGTLVEFASAVEAVECAAAIQAGIAEREATEPQVWRIRYRIGINIGDIVLEDGDIFGDGVNVAARLEGLAEPDGICIARNVYDQVKTKLELGFEPMGEHRVKNIAEPIVVYRVLPRPGGARTRPAAIAWAVRGRQPAIAAAAALIVAAAMAGAWYTFWGPALEPGVPVVTEAAARPALSLPDKPSIAVLPFDNLSGDPRQERLAGGLTEDVITDLSRFRELFVIARNSTEVYKGKAVDVRQVARELGVQYVLEGSLQTDGEQVRITAQLINGGTGNHVWAERYDRPLANVFVVQDEVTKKIAGTLAPSMGGVLTRAGRDSARRKPPESLQAYENYLLGMEYLARLTPQDNQKAQELLTKAIEVDLSFARAYVGLAWVHVVALDNGWASRQDSLDKMSKALRTAIALDSSDGLAHVALGAYYSYFGDSEHGLAELEKAVTLNPNDADVLMEAAMMMTWFGTPEQAAELAEKAVRLNPNHPEYYNRGLLFAYFYTGQYERALAATQRKLTLDIYDYVYRPLIYAQLGRKADVATALSDLVKRDPDYSAERMLSNTGPYARDIELNRFLDSHRKVGLPLCASEGQLAKYPDMLRMPQCEAQRASG
jgi:TolB-like protein/class 3 adenylate cyclase/tetratricopeptide (TPR) repeat protein